MTHGLRGKLSTLFLVEGPSDSSVAILADHRDPRSLESYRHLLGVEVEKQRRDSFGKEGCGRAPKHLPTDYSLVENKAGIHHLSSDLEALVHHPTSTEFLTLPRERVSQYMHVGSMSGGTLNVTLNVVTHGRHLK